VRQYVDTTPSRPASDLPATVSTTISANVASHLQPQHAIIIFAIGARRSLSSAQTILNLLLILPQPIP
jgi:hypothetical protein